MSVDKFKPAPGKWLHEAIMGALKGRGVSFTGWCEANGILSQSMRAYTYGINSSPKSEKVLNKLIDDAGREAVLSMYFHRLLTRRGMAAESLWMNFKPPVALHDYSHLKLYD